MTSIEIAVAQNKEGRALVPEVCIFFENHLMRGNRTTKMNAENFNAFRSFNYPVLAEAGIHIKYNNVQIHVNGEERELKPHYLLDTNVVVLKLFPGIQENVIAAILGIDGLKAVVLETYGSGKRNLAKINYRIHTDAIKENLIPPELSARQMSLVYASEADVLNMALFGKTAKQWRDENPGLKGNIRDYANVSQLVCLSNLENLNAVFINDGLPQPERLAKLNAIAIQQMRVLTEDHRILKLEKK